MSKKVLILDNSRNSITPAIMKAMSKPEHNTVFVGFDLARGEDCQVEIKGLYVNDKLIITDFKTIERQPDVQENE